MDRAESQLKSGDVKYYIWTVNEVTVTLNDTVTLDAFVAAENPKFVAVVRQDTGAEIAVTYVAGTNVVTVTGAAVNLECIIFAFGRKA